VKLLWTVGVTTVIALASTFQIAQAPSPKPPRAPTYYPAVNVQSCAPESIHFRGASNLPGGAMIAMQVDDFNGDGWQMFSDWIYVPVGGDGFFRGEIQPSKLLRFQHNLTLIASFATNLHKQPSDVIRVVGEKGWLLAGVENPSQNFTELSGLSQNPQLYQASGWYHGLETIARVGNCGEKQ
jgi:hypothetical protein